MPKRKYLVLLAMNGLLVALDQLTKILVVSSFRLNQTKVVIQNFFNFTLIHNPGAAFGFLADVPPSFREPFFLVVPVLTLALILYAFSRISEEQTMNIFALAMIVGGAVGNLIDRIRLGYVIDFLDFHWSFGYHFPAFNIADSGITIGVLLLLIGMALERPRAKAASAA